MAYQISEGIAEKDLPTWLKEARHKYGTFPDGRVDYTKAPLAPIIMCTVLCQDKILLAKRGYGLADAEGYWSTINGFIDEDKPIRAIAAQELEEELGLMANDIRVGQSYTLSNTQEKRNYIVFPCLVTLKSKPKITLNAEHTDFAWIKQDELKNYHILDDLAYAVDVALKLR